MSEVSDRLTLQAPSRYNSLLFKLVQHNVRPSNNAPNNQWYSQGNEVVFNLGGSANEFILPETAMLTFVAKAFGSDTIPATGDAANYYTGASSTGLPRLDLGCPFFSLFEAKINGSKPIQVDVGEDQLRTYYNGTLACSPFGSVPDAYEVGTYNNRTTNGQFMVSKHNGQGALKYCGFRSDFSRISSFCGSYRRGAGDAGGAAMNGALTYRYPLALFTGLFSAENSGYIPVGMLSQQAASGIQLRFQLARGTSVVQEGSRSKSFLLAYGANMGDLDGVGATSRATDPYGIFTPTITYRSLLILDNELMQVMQAIFEGGVAEMVSFGGSNVPIYRNLMLKYPSHRIFDYIHRTGVASSYYDIPISQPSVRGIFLRMVPVVYANNAVSKAPDWYSTDFKSLVVRSLSFKVGSATYPLEPILNDSNSSLALADPGAIANAAANNALLRTQNVMDSGALMSAYDLEGKHIFSPFKEVSYASVYEDVGSENVQLGDGFYAPPNKSQTRELIHPFTMSLENSSSTLEVHEITRDALYGVRGLDLRGISNIRLELTIGHSRASGTPHTTNFTPPESDVRVVLGVVYDSVMSIKRGAIDTSAEYALF
jgi:hypothetical protein